VCRYDRLGRHRHALFHDNLTDGSAAAQRWLIAPLAQRLTHRRGEILIGRANGANSRKLWSPVSTNDEFQLGRIASVSAFDPGAGAPGDHDREQRNK